jgi:hypothetical protein
VPSNFRVGRKVCGLLHFAGIQRKNLFFDFFVRRAKADFCGDFPNSLCHKDLRRDRPDFPAAVELIREQKSST